MLLTQIYKIVSTTIKSSIPHIKIDIILLSTLFLNKALIAEYINILKKYLKRLGIEDIAILNKLLIFKNNFLTIHNITRLIYQY